MSSIKFSILLLLLVVSMSFSDSGTVGGDVVVNWGGNYVSSSQDFQGINSYQQSGVDADGDGSDDDSIGGRTFNLNTPMNPTMGYSGTSGKFYGGGITARRDEANAVGFDDFGIQNHGPNDDMHFHLSQSGHFHDAHTVLHWKQEDFLNGDVPYYFDANSSAVLTMGQGSTESMVGAQARLLVQDINGDFWLSQTAFTSPQGAGDSFTWSGFTATSDGLWATFDPNASFTGGAAGSDLRFDEANAIFVDKKFSSLQAVGIHFEQDTFHNNLDFHFSGFQLNAKAVPEPAGMGLVVALFSFLLVERRRK